MSANPETEEAVKPICEYVPLPDGREVVIFNDSTQVRLYLRVGAYLGCLCGNRHARRFCGTCRFNKCPNCMDYEYSTRECYDCQGGD